MEKTHPSPWPLLGEFTKTGHHPAPFTQTGQVLFPFQFMGRSAGALSGDCRQAPESLRTFTRRALTLIFQVVSLSRHLYCTGARRPCFVLLWGHFCANGALLIGRDLRLLQQMALGSSRVRAGYSCLWLL